MDPDPIGAVRSGSTLFDLEAYKTFQQKTKADDLCYDVRFKGKFPLDVLKFSTKMKLICFEVGGAGGGGVERTTRTPSGSATGANSHINVHL